MKRRAILSLAIASAGLLFAALPASPVPARTPYREYREEFEVLPVAARLDGAAFARELLIAHNRERDRMGVPPLRWNEALASGARQWASTLARRRAFEHSYARNLGENLWMGTSGTYTPHDMIGGFIDERRDFRPGRFPNVSRTGNWADVGHYTQLIWANTQSVGCALARGGGDDYLVCRYWPAGNVIGQRVP